MLCAYSDFLLSLFSNFFAFSLSSLMSHSKAAHFQPMLQYSPTANITPAVQTQIYLDYLIGILIPF